MESPKKYEFLISSFVKKFLPKFHVSKEMKRSTRRVTFEPLECRHMLSASTLTEAPVLAYQTIYHWRTSKDVENLSFLSRK